MRREVHRKRLNAGPEGSGSYGASQLELVTRNFRHDYLIDGLRTMHGWSVTVLISFLALLPVAFERSPPNMLMPLQKSKGDSSGTSKTAHYTIETVRCIPLTFAILTAICRSKGRSISI